METASMWRELKLAQRMLVRDRTLSTVVIITTALGIGGSTAVFTVVNAVLMGRGMRLTAVGIVLGTIGAVMLRQVLASQLHGVSPLELPVFLLVTTICSGSGCSPASFQRDEP